MLQQARRAENDAAARWAEFRVGQAPECLRRLRDSGTPVVLSMSCALWLPADVPPLQPGTRLAEVQVELDADTHFVTGITPQHVSAVGPSVDAGVRQACEWHGLAPVSERLLQRWIDRAQQSRRPLPS